MNTETAIMKITGDREIQRQFLEMSHLYDAAIREVRTKLEILDREFSILYASNPIHHIDSRLKSPRSIIGKLERKGLPVTIESAEANLQDIAGVRIVCNYIDDIYRLADLLVRQQDLELVARKDYIENPKPNGYRSLHLVLRVRSFCPAIRNSCPWRFRSARSPWTSGRAWSTNCAIRTTSRPPRR